MPHFSLISSPYLVVWRKLFLIVGYWTIFQLVSKNCEAQVKISGIVTDTLGKVVTSASITLSDNSKGKLLAFTISDTKGRYVIEGEFDSDVLLLSTKAFNFRDTGIFIKNHSGTYNFRLRPQATELPVVVVTPPPISQRKDTINYLVSQFSDQRDRSIADVLSKIPGVEVLPDGKVLYQGKPIQKYYIEGMDLLEGRYNLANQNLPHQSVSSIQILENHQPIRIVDSLIQSDRASLNIKLKNGIAVTGMGSAGAGLSPLLWDGAITPMIFKQKLQTISSYQFNNTGHDVGKQIKALSVDAIMDMLDNPGITQQNLQIIDIASPPISSKRFLDNNVHMLTGNTLQKLPNDWELRINASYINDVQFRAGNSKTFLFTPQGQVQISEEIGNRNYINELTTEIGIQQNNSKGFFKNTTSFTMMNNSSKGDIFTSIDTISQLLKQPISKISNHLKWTTAIGKQLFSFYSMVQYSNAPHSLQISPGQFKEVLNRGSDFEWLEQQLKQRLLVTNHYAEILKGIKAWTFNARAGLRSNTQLTDSDIWVDGMHADTNATNQVKTNHIIAYARTQFIYKGKRGDFTITLPINGHFFSLRDYVKDTSNRRTLATFDPVLLANVNLNSYWRLFSSLSRQNMFLNFHQTLSGWVANNYRNIRINDIPIIQNRTVNFTSGTSYRNAIKGSFANFSYIFQRSAMPFIISHTILPEGTTSMVAVPIQNVINSHSVQLKKSRYFKNIKTTFTLGLDFSWNISNQILNDATTQSINRILTPSAKVNSRLGSLFSLDYQSKFAFATNEVGRSMINRFQNLQQNLQLHFFPSERHYFGVMGESLLNVIENERTHALYPDLIYRYTIPKKRVDIQVSLMNLLNEKSYLSTSYTDFYFLQSFFQIRPRQFLLSVKFQL